MAYGTASGEKRAVVGDVQSSPKISFAELTAKVSFANLFANVMWDSDGDEGNHHVQVFSGVDFKLVSWGFTGINALGEERQVDIWLQAGKLRKRYLVNLLNAVISNNLWLRNQPLIPSPVWFSFTPLTFLQTHLHPDKSFLVSFI